MMQAHVVSWAKHTTSLSLTTQSSTEGALLGTMVEPPAIKQIPPPGATPWSWAICSGIAHAIVTIAEAAALMISEGWRVFDLRRQSHLHAHDKTGDPITLAGDRYQGWHPALKPERCRPENKSLAPHLRKRVYGDRGAPALKGQSNRQALDCWGA